MRSGDELKNRSLVARGRVLNVMAAAAMILLSTGASALGLGRVNVQSVLGEALHAEIEVTSLNAEESSSLRVSLASPDAFKASGVEYNPVLVGATVTMTRRADGRPVLVLQSDKIVQEPFVDVIVEFQWSTGRLTRSYTLLIDPPGRNTAAQPGSTAVAPVFDAGSGAAHRRACSRARAAGGRRAAAGRIAAAGTRADRARHAGTGAPHATRPGREPRAQARRGADARAERGSVRRRNRQGSLGRHADVARRGQQQAGRVARPDAGVVHVPQRTRRRSSTTT